MNISADSNPVRSKMPKTKTFRIFGGDSEMKSSSVVFHFWRVSLKNIFRHNSRICFWIFFVQDLYKKLYKNFSRVILGVFSRNSFKNLFRAFLVFLFYLCLLLLLNAFWEFLIKSWVFIGMSSIVSFRYHSRLFFKNFRNSSTNFTLK